MAFILVQFWGLLLTNYEGFMGDTPTGRPAGEGDFARTTHVAGTNSAQPSSPSPFDESDGRKVFQGGSQTYGPQVNYPNIQSFPTQQYGSQSRQDHFNMAALGTALPDMSYINYSNVSPQRYPSGPSPSPHVYQLQSIPQIGGPPSMSPPATNLSYNLPYQAQYQGMYVPGHSPPPAGSQSGLNTGSQFYQGQVFLAQQPGSPYFIPQGQYGPQNQMYSGSPSSAQYGSRAAFIGDNRLLPQQRGSNHQAGSPNDGAQGRSSSICK
jgi:hypothetical protein